MRKSHSCPIVAAALVACVTGALLGQTTNPVKPALKNRIAIEAMRVYDDKELDAHRAYVAVVEKARAELVKQLGAAQTQATKAGDLDEALKIRDALAQAKAAVVPAKPGGATTTTRGARKGIRARRACARTLVNVTLWTSRCTLRAPNVHQGVDGSLAKKR